MTLEDAIRAWSSRLDDYRQLRPLVDGQAVCEAILADLRAITVGSGEETLNLTAAAVESGYSREHLGRLVRAGIIPNGGRPNAPKIRRADLPLKAGYLPPERVPDDLAGASKRQIVRSIVDLSRRRGTR